MAYCCRKQSFLLPLISEVGKLNSVLVVRVSTILAGSGVEAAGCTGIRNRSMVTVRPEPLRPVGMWDNLQRSAVSFNETSTV